MIRRQLISDELRYSHQTSPRKTRTIQGSSLNNPTILYIHKLEKNMLEKPNHWIGKKLIQWDGEYIQPYLREKQLGLNNPSVISEFEIANYCKPNTYRILYGFKKNGKFYIKSKPSVEWVPSRMNIVLTPDNIIQQILYF